MPFLSRRLAKPDVPLAPDTFSWSTDTYRPQDSLREVARHARPRNEDRICANPECSGRWKMPWKNRRRPIFEGGWGCTTRCLEALVNKAMRRERGDHRAADQDVPHKHRVPLGLIMLSQGLITQAQLRQALDAQRAAGQGRIGDWLITECGLHPGHVTRGLATQWSCPVLPPDGFVASSMALTVPRLLLEERRMLPLRVAASRILYLGFSDRLDAAAALALEQMTGLRVESGLINDAHFERAHRSILGSTFAPASQEFFSDTDSLSTRITTVLGQSQPVGSRLVRMHQHYWLRTWLEAGAYSGIGSIPSTGEDVVDTIFTLDATGKTM
jgi:hypothetical protein